MAAHTRKVPWMSATCLTTVGPTACTVMWSLSASGLGVPSLRQKLLLLSPIPTVCSFLEERRTMLTTRRFLHVVLSVVTMYTAGYGQDTRPSRVLFDRMPS